MKKILILLIVMLFCSFSFAEDTTTTTKSLVSPELIQEYKVMEAERKLQFKYEIKEEVRQAQLQLIRARFNYRLDRRFRGGRHRYYSRYGRYRRNVRYYDMYEMRASP